MLKIKTNSSFFYFVMKNSEINAIIFVKLKLGNDSCLSLGSDKIMNKQQIIDLLNIGEQREVEFKESKKKLPK